MFFKEQNKRPGDPTVPLLGTCPVEWKMRTQTKLVHMCAGQGYSQEPKGGSKPNVHQCRADKQHVVLPCDGILFNHEKEVPDTRMNLEQVVLSERKPDTKGHVLFDSVCMECPEPASPQVQKAVLAARGSGGDCQEVRGAFWGGDNALELGSSGG